MQIIPAIDIRGGKVVRLVQGKIENEKVYFDDPVSVAERWASFNVGLIHIVDLDGAITGELKNIGLVKKMIAKIKPKVELGGGIRDLETIKWIFDAGVHKIVIGTRALERVFLEKAAKVWGERIIVGIDAKDGTVYTKGWLNKSEMKAIDLARICEDVGIKTINYTDISRDGTMQGFNLVGLKELLDSTSVDIVAGGGITTIEDVEKLKSFEKHGLSGVVIGKALYEGTIKLEEAIEIVK